jgi:ComF family protein
MKRLLNFILPPRCANCSQQIAHSHSLCSECWRKIDFLSEPYCQKCGYPFEIDLEGFLCPSCLYMPPSYNHLRAACRYNEASKALLMRFKYGGATSLAPLFVKWLAYAGGDFVKEADIILPVPLHWRRLIKRGYNQAALLAQGLSKAFHKTYAYNILKRNRYTPSQGRRTLEQRIQNVQGVFKIPSSKQKIIEGKKILLIDDVYTSGATIRECVKVLKHFHPECVNVLTLARVVHPNILKQ